MATKAKKPNILVMWGDDIGQANLSCYTKGLMGYRTPNIDRIAKEGMIFTDSYAEQSCTAGRSSFITGQCGLRTSLTKVGLPGADLGLKAEDITIAEALKPLGYRTGQFGKTTSVTAMNTCPPRMGSTNSSATCTTSMRKRSLKKSTIPARKTSRTSRRSTARAVCCTAGPMARAARRSKTPAR